VSTHTSSRMVKVGDRASFTKSFSHEDVVLFAEVSGDHNPIHLNEEYAADTRFGRPIVHGILTAGLVSSVLGNELPGPGSVYLSQMLRFRAPVYYGDTVTAIVEVTAVREDKPIVTLRTTCFNQAGQVVVEGEAVLLVPT